MSVTTFEIQVRAAYDAYIAAAHRLGDARRQGVRSEIRKADREMTALVEKYHQVKAATRDAFAKARGWRYDRKRWAYVREYGTYCRRIVKNPEFFRDTDGAHVGMITHTAAKMEEVSAYAVRNGYNAEVLSFSWDAPDYHTAVLFTLKDGAKWP